MKTEIGIAEKEKERDCQFEIKIIRNRIPLYDSTGKKGFLQISQVSDLYRIGTDIYVP